MIIIDKILDWARGRGYTAVYGSSEQVNEMLTDVPFADSKDATAVVMHLVTDSATVNGKDTAVVAVYFASLCDFDFDGESLLPEQERLKDIGKELLNDIRTGNVMTYSDPRWQYGYDDYAENVCWACLRVTITASAADCVPLSPEPPTPPPGPEYNYFCPQVMNGSPGKQNPMYSSVTRTLTATLALPPDAVHSLFGHFVAGAQSPTSYRSVGHGIISEELIASLKSTLEGYGENMTEETEMWLRDRIGWRLNSYYRSNYTMYEYNDYRDWLLAWSDAMIAENKKIKFYGQ